MPLLLMLAGRDRIVDNRRTRAFFHRTGAVNRTLIEYPHAAHTLEFEPDPDPYFSDLTDWITSATSRRV
jgi:alpha-beta hydrolase superfamily lysophospholipase